ncbi:CU044_2847 family protein [Nocardia sp. NPDC058519]|uniref:CU044_2847 family protein n=1 Tax=unclassified Nocardia TaxID=2637762 RepID=UPI0036698E96
MTRIEQLELPDGTEVFARIDGLDDAEDDAETPGVTDIALGFGSRLENLGPTIRGVASSVHASVAGLSADSVSVEFGIELSMGTGGVIAVIASGGAKTSVKVRLDWDLRGDDDAEQSQP